MCAIVQYSNGLIREFMPKGKSMKNFTDAYIAKVQDALNNRLRKSLGYLSASAAYPTFHTNSVDFGKLNNPQCEALIKTIAAGTCTL